MEREWKNMLIRNTERGSKSKLSIARNNTREVPEYSEKPDRVSGRKRTLTNTHLKEQQERLQRY